MTTQTMTNAGTYLAQALGISNRDGISIVERAVALFAAGESEADILRRLNRPAPLTQVVARAAAHSVATGETTMPDARDLIDAVDTADRAVANVRHLLDRTSRH